jgi:hypothetical protein
VTSHENINDERDETTGEEDHDETDAADRTKKGLHPGGGIEMGRLYPSTKGTDSRFENDAPTERSTEGLGTDRAMPTYHPI